MFNRYLLNLTIINQYLTDTENQFDKALLISVKYQLSISLYQLYWLNVSLNFYLKDF